MEIGECVTFVDAEGAPHPALVTALFPGMSGADAQPGVNLVFVNEDPNARDQYGHQLERATSVVHQDSQPAHGMFWAE